MLTIEEIRNIEFSRGRGYRAEEVDDFIDECVVALESLQRTNETLTRKMKVMADKLVDYRAQEDNIRVALVNAQRTGDAILQDANDKASKILSAAEQQAKRLRTDARAAAAAEHEEVERLHREVAAFRERLRSMYYQHLTLLDMLPEKPKLPTEEPAAIPAEPPIAEAIEEPAEEPVQELTEEAAVPSEEQGTEEPIPESSEQQPAAEPTAVTAEEEPAPPTPTVVEPDETDPFAADAELMKNKSRFSDLKFGADYNIADDDDDEPKKRRFFGRKTKK